MTVKLKVKRTPPPDPKGRTTLCPGCGSERIEWKLSLEKGGRHSYVCPECGYDDPFVLETDVE